MTNKETENRLQELEKQRDLARSFEREHAAQRLDQQIEMIRNREQAFPKQMAAK